MPAATPSPPRIEGTLWAVVRTDRPGAPEGGASGGHGADGPGPDPSASGLEALASAVDGVISVGGRRPRATHAHVTVPPHASAGRCLAAAIRHLPPDAGAVVWLAGHVTGSGAAVARLAAAVGDRDAAVFAAPVTEAVKEVVDGRVRGAIDRAQLCVPAPPLLVRADVAARVLLDLLDAGHEPIPALAVGRLRIGRVPAAP